MGWLRRVLLQFLVDNCQNLSFKAPGSPKLPWWDILTLPDRAAEIASPTRCTMEEAWLLLAISAPADAGRNRCFLCFLALVGWKLLRVPGLFDVLFSENACADALLEKKLYMTRTLFISFALLGFN